MAGSFRHCDAEGAFHMDLIENMGDAHEALEMMHFMIRWLAGARALAVSVEQGIREAEDAYFRSVNPTYQRRAD